MSKQQFTFKKEERLCSLKAIEKLFAEGKSINENPVKIIYMMQDADEIIPVKIAFAVPKKQFKKAVDRNRIKRQMREIYRVNKHELYGACRVNNKSLAVMLIFTGKTFTNFNQLKDKIIVILQRLQKSLVS